MPTELNLSEPSAWESFLKTIGLGGYAVRNLLQGNVEGAGANVVDLLSSPIRAILPGDQSNWEASRKQDLPEFSDVMQSWGADKMDPGLLKTGVDIVGSIATDPLTYLPGGILLKGAKGATAGARSALRAVSPTADMLLTKGLHNVRSVAGALKPAEAVAEDIAKGQGAAAIVRNPLQEAAIADFGKFDPRVSEAIANAMEAVKGTPGKMVPHGTPFPEAFGTRASKVSYLENQLRTMGLDPAVEAKALEVAPKVVDLSDVTYREAIERGTMYRPEVYTDEAGDIIPAAPLHQVFEESDKAIAKELRFHKNEIARYNQRTAAGEAKVSQLAPVEESLLARYAAASEKSDDLLDKLPDLRTRKRAFDALDEKVASRQAAADVIGRMESRSGTRQVNLQNQLNSANDAIKQHRDALAALKAATITATEPEILETLKLNAKIAAAESSLRMGELVSMAKQGAFGELPVAYDAMKLARKQASAARKEYDAARAAGVDAQEVARLRDIKDSLMEAAEVAQKSLRRINTRLSESGGYDKAISGSAVREGGKLRELRALMQQLDDPDLARVPGMERTQARAAGAVSALAPMESQVSRRLGKARENLLKDEWNKYGEQVALEGVERPSFQDWAQNFGYKLAPLKDDLSPLYLPRQHEIDDLMKSGMTEGAAQAQALKSRKIPSGKEYADYLNTPGVTRVTDLAKIYGRYGEQMGSAAAQTAIGKSLLTRLNSPAAGKALVEPEFRPAVNAAIEDFKTQADAANKAGNTALAGEMLDSAQALDVAFNGVKSREGLMKLIAWGNTLFKPFATAGAFIPRISFTIRNMLGGGTMQVLAQAETRGEVLPYLKRLVPDMMANIGDGLKQLGVNWLPESRFDKITQAARASKGSSKAFVQGLEAMDPDLALAVKHGILDNNFVSTEMMVNSAATRGNWKSLANWRDWPQAIARGSEQRMRFGVFDGLVKKGMNPADAARATTSAFYDYAFSGAGNSAARDLIPFFQFSAKAIPQSVEFALGSKLGSTIMFDVMRPLQAQGDENPIYPYMQKNLNVPLGRDAEGLQHYISGLGTPQEALGLIPNPSADPATFLREARQNVVGQATPPLKFLASALMNVDPYFGTPFRSFAKTPEALQALGLPKESEIGRNYQMLKQTGLAQGVLAPVDLASQWLDPRNSMAEKVSQLIVGAPTAAVDENQAMSQILQQRLRDTPSIKQYVSMYNQGNSDPEAVALLSAYKASRKAQTAASAAAMTPEQKAAQASLKLQELRARTEADPTIPDNIKKQRLLLIDKRLGKLEVPGGK